jgi:hypothetical protein
LQTRKHITHLYDQLHAADVEAACSHVSRHQHAELAAAEASQRRLALRLGNVAVQSPAAAAAAAAARSSSSSMSVRCRFCKCMQQQAVCQAVAEQYMLLHTQNASNTPAQSASS